MDRPVPKPLRVFYPIFFVMFISAFLFACGGGGGGNSSSTTGSEPSPLMNTGASYYNGLIANGISEEVAVNDTVIWFKTQKDVSDAYPAADKRNIFIKETNGVTTLFITRSFSNMSSSATNILPKYKLNEDIHLRALAPVVGVKAIVMDPYNLSISNSSSVNKVLSDNGVVVKYIKGTDVTPEVFQDFSGNDLIYYVGHGGIDDRNGGITFIGTGVSFSKLTAYVNKYNDNLGNPKYFGRIYDAEKGINNIGINSNFIADYSKGLNATAVYVDACHSLDFDINDTMAKAFMNNGAKSYLGWGGLVAPWLVVDTTYRVAVSFFNDVLSCKSVSTAFNNLPFDFNITDLHYRGDGILPICIAESNIPGAISVNPASGLWTSSPQNLAVSSSNATAIYYTMQNTTDGSTPGDPREPTSSDNDGSISVSGGAGTFQLYAAAGQYKQSKIRFRAYNSIGAGPASGVFSYSIDLRSGSSIPAVQTLAATSITTSTATLNGNVNPNGLATTYWFEYGTIPTLATFVSTTAKSAGSGTTSQSFSEPISGLQAGTTYYFRMAAINSDGTSRGAIAGFSTTNGSSTIWSKTYGGAYYDSAAAVQQTSDGGYIIAGQTESFGAVSTDIYMIKVDASGNTLWSKTYGGTGVDSATDVRQTTDGGYIIAGSTGHDGAGDAHLIKTDANGNALWSKTYGGTGDDHAYAVRPTADGGYIIAGVTHSFGAGMFDAYLIKTDTNGNALWSKTYGGTGGDVASAVQQTSDGGYILAGHTTSFGAGDSDVYLIKTEANGNVLWSKTYGGTNSDSASAVQQTSDGGYIIAGNIFHDVCLIKTDASGNSLWTKTFGGGGSDGASDVQQTSDGGYIIAGSTNSFIPGNTDVYLIKTDANGDAP